MASNKTSSVYISYILSAMYDGVTQPAMCCVCHLQPHVHPKVEHCHFLDLQRVQYWQPQALVSCGSLSKSSKVIDIHYVSRRVSNRNVLEVTRLAEVARSSHFQSRILCKSSNQQIIYTIENKLVIEDKPILVYFLFNCYNFFSIMFL